MPDDHLKALSLWQPWASAMAYRLKRNETRDWPTKYRGPLLIHAAARKPDWMDWNVLTYPPVAKALQERGIGDERSFPLGVAVCIVNLVDCVPVESIRDSLNPVELALGNYNDGRFAWITEFLHKIEKPIPMKGHQRLWNCDMGYFCDSDGNPLACLETVNWRGMMGYDARERE